MDNMPTVLVIEDHDSVRILRIAVSRFLEKGGFNVLSAATPDAARALPHLLFTRG
jgi:hypothetical protein